MYPLPTVKEEELEDVSVFPITNELEVGVKDVTAGVVDPPEELPVDVEGLVVEAPLISYTETEPVTEPEKEAVIVSVPALAEVAYQT